MITVSTLIQFLQTLPDDARIVLSSDAEGNSLSFMGSSTPIGAFNLKREEFVDDEHEYESALDEPGFVKAVIFYPE